MNNNERPRDILNNYLALGQRFQNPPVITLELMSRVPPGNEDNEVSSRDIAVSCAYQCYRPGKTKMSPRTDQRANNVAESTLIAGHHSTRMNAYYTHHIDGASRLVIHDVLHKDPFYNSGQQSMRYTEAKKGYYLAPTHLTSEQLAFYHQAADYANTAYFSLLAALKPAVVSRVIDNFPKAGWNVPATKKRYEDKVVKLCQEIARYALPLAQQSNLKHTSDELRLLRLFRASANMTDEGKYIIAEMINTVALYDPSIYDELPEPLPRQTSIPHRDTIRQMKVDFDARLNGHQTALLSITQNPRDTLEFAAYATTGISNPLPILLNPSKNPDLTDLFDSGMHQPLTSTLRQISLTFITRLSHAADSQAQRHRGTPRAPAAIEAVIDGTSDYMTPLVIREDTKVNALYTEQMEVMFDNVNRALALGIPLEYAAYQLPNSVNIRATESGDGFDWFHRWRQRACFTAQEEIFFTNIDQMLIFLTTFPEARHALLAPCGIRKTAGISPRCPEADKWCGQPVFNYDDLANYPHHRII